ncbi:MAG: alpha-mannosidase [Anaerolineae bacterium]
MPTYKPYTKHELGAALERIGEAVYTVVGDLDIRAWWTREPVPFEARTQGKELHLDIGDKWGDLFDCAWFHFTGEVPAGAEGEHVVLLLDVNGELCVVDEEGHPKRGLTCVASTYDFSLGKPGKRVLEVTTEAVGGEPIDVWADAGCNDLFGRLPGNGTVAEAAVAICDDQARALYYDFEVLLDFLQVLPEDTPRYQQILTGLNDVVHLWFSAAARDADWRRDLAQEGRAILAPLLAKRGGDPSLEISAVGHAHMDLAWLWPIRETIRKGARTFSTALTLMDRYPDYVFGASQPQYYQWMKEHYPDLYRRIKAKVREGRIEPQGAMWVEADANVSGGEALVRQLLYGKRFFRDEFGVDVDYLWLPDVFGYNAALPQILRQAGVRYFSTQKLSWSLINAFPHQSFHWQGIDGTTVLTHMLPEETYNSPAAPRSVRKIERNYHDAGVSSHALMVFGIGDGGGGPGEEHLERLERIRDLAGLSPVKQERVADFLPVWAGEANRFPTWVGELYLERHEGTLTTQARNKRYNRTIELALRELEWIATVSAHLLDEVYPAEELDAIWREVLLYQFHDILPGSSIKRVYDESLVRYAEMLGAVESQIETFGARLAEQIDTTGLEAPVVVHNSLPWSRKAWLKINERWLHATAPPMGYAAIDAASEAEIPSDITATDRELDNGWICVTFGEDGTIRRLYDRQLEREMIPEGSRANRLVVYHDPGDAWDFPMDYREQTPLEMRLVSQTPSTDGPRAVMTQVYRLGHSEMIQEITLEAGRPSVEVACRLHWRETASMLRVQFPVKVHAEAATYEIQFGSVSRPTHRNTTWDLARDEVAAHKWVDLSDGGYGLALLNDCKYGHRVKQEGEWPVIDLNLLRSVPHPGPRLVADDEVAPGEPHPVYTDQADHVFTYALYPHAGDYADGGVIQAAYELNVPLRRQETTAHEGGLGAAVSLLTLDAANVVIEAVKQAEDSDAIIIRLYEAAGRSTAARLSFGFQVGDVAEVNLLEENPQPVDVSDGAVTLTFKPFEIRTLRIDR